MAVPGPDLLLERARSGDSSAVEDLLVRHLPALQGFVRLKCGPKLRELESCSDLVQSVCREVLERVDRFKGDGEVSFKAWLFRTATRKVVDRARFHGRAKRNASRRERISSGVDPSPAYVTIFTPSRQAMGREEVERVERAFDQLAAPQRDAILLTRVAGLSYLAAAGELNVTEAYARVLAARGRARLATLLEGFDQA